MTTKNKDIEERQVIPPLKPAKRNRVRLTIINDTDVQLLRTGLYQNAGKATCGNGNGYIGPHQALQYNFSETYTGNLDFSLGYLIFNKGSFQVKIKGNVGRTPAEQYVQISGYQTRYDVDVYYLGTRNGVKLFNVVVSDNTVIQD